MSLLSEVSMTIGPNMPISSCFLKLTLETRDADQIEQIRTELTKAGFQLVTERV